MVCIQLLSNLLRTFRFFSSPPFSYSNFISVGIYIWFLRNRYVKKNVFLSIFSLCPLPYCVCCCLKLNTIGTTTNTNRVCSFAVWAKWLINPCIIQRCGVGVAGLAMVIGGWLSGRDGGKVNNDGPDVVGKVLQTPIHPQSPVWKRRNSASAEMIVVREENRRWIIENILEIRRRVKGSQTCGGVRLSTCSRFCFSVWIKKKKKNDFRYLTVDTLHLLCTIADENDWRVRYSSMGFDGVRHRRRRSFARGIMEIN